jgi:hypothetical protein
MFLLTEAAYDYWHYSRPVIGAVVGGIGCMLFYVSILAGAKSGVTPSRAITFDAVAFLLGSLMKHFENRSRSSRSCYLVLAKHATVHLAVAGIKTDSGRPIVRNTRW